MTDPLVTALPVDDVFTDDDGSVVLLAGRDGHRVVRLSALGESVRRLAEGGIVLSELTLALVTRFGPPDGQSELYVREAVSGLESAGLVRVDA